MKYTSHKLSEHQLKFLSQIVNGRQRNFFQPTLDVLEKRGLIAKHSVASWRHTFGDYYATDAGSEALTQARKEGW